MLEVHIEIRTYNLNLTSSINENIDFVNAIKTQKAPEPKIEKLLETLISEMRLTQRENQEKFNQLFNNFRNNSNNDTRQSNPNRRKGYFNGVKISDLKGFCVYEVLSNGCNRKNTCKYQHDNIPSSIRNLKK